MTGSACFFPLSLMSLQTSFISSYSILVRFRYIHLQCLWLLSKYHTDI